MKKFFQRSPRTLKGTGRRGSRRLTVSRGSGQSSSRERSAGSHVTGFRSIKIRSGTMTARDQYETS